jgi:hypothetical protein
MKPANLMLLILCVGCSPNFESGKTECSDKGECPSGFICLNNGTSNLCYDSNTPPFTGGSGGRGGSGGVVAATTGGQGGGTAGTSGTTACTDPSYPVRCSATGTYPGGCWASGVVCSTITDCGTGAAPDWTACGTTGYHPDCSGTKCLPNVGAGADAGSSTCTPPAASGTCNVFPSCGCPAGQVCYPATQATGMACLASTGLQEGTDCTTGVCVSGFGCFGYLCKRYCQSDSDCPLVDSARACLQTTWSPGVDISGVLVCARVCDPVSPQNPSSPLLACPAAFGCSAAGTTYPGASSCVKQPGAGTTSSTCTTVADCLPGNYCSTGHTCNKYCFTSTDCPAGSTCNYFSTPEYAGTRSVGYCK